MKKQHPNDDHIEEKIEPCGCTYKKFIAPPPANFSTLVTYCDKHKLA